MPRGTPTSCHRPPPARSRDNADYFHRVRMQRAGLAFLETALSAAIRKSRSGIHAHSYRTAWFECRDWPGSITWHLSPLANMRHCGRALDRSICPSRQSVKLLSLDAYAPVKSRINVARPSLRRGAFSDNVPPRFLMGFMPSS
jgi:hypothetical protein